MIVHSSVLREAWPTVGCRSWRWQWEDLWIKKSVVVGFTINIDRLLSERREIDWSKKLIWLPRELNERVEPIRKFQKFLEQLGGSSPFTQYVIGIASPKKWCGWELVPRVEKFNLQIRPWRLQKLNIAALIQGGCPLERIHKRSHYTNIC